MSILTSLVVGSESGISSGRSRSRPPAALPPHDAQHQARPELRRHRLPRLAAQPAHRTVQQVLEEALGRLTGVEPATNASGRTDTGVHALGQVVHFYTASRHAPEVFVKALNAMLPPDVRVLDATEMPQSFHATLDARAKLYRYEIDNGRFADPFRRRYSLHVYQALDESAMHRAARRSPAGTTSTASRRTGPTAPAASGRSPTSPSSGRGTPSGSVSRPTGSCTIWSGRSRGRSCSSARGAGPNPRSPRRSPPRTDARPGRPRRRRAFFWSASATPEPRSRPMPPRLAWLAYLSRSP